MFFIASWLCELVSQDPHLNFRSIQVKGKIELNKSISHLITNHTFNKHLWCGNSYGHLFHILLSPFTISETTMFISHYTGTIRHVDGNMTRELSVGSLLVISKMLSKNKSNQLADIQNKWRNSVFDNEKNDQYIFSEV